MRGRDGELGQEQPFRPDDGDPAGVPQRTPRPIVVRYSFEGVQDLRHEKNCVGYVSICALEKEHFPYSGKRDEEWSRKGL